MSDKINSPAASVIKRQGLANYMSTLFGWKQSASAIDMKRVPVDFVNVDIGNPGQRLSMATADQLLKKGKLSDRLEELFNSWLSDNTDSAGEIIDRSKRVDQLQYAKLNDPFIGRVVALYADEASQLDIQDRLIGIETPDPRMSKAMYGLLNRWGVTQQRVRAAFEQLASFGDAFWANKVSENGVEKIIPLKQLQVTNRLEFNPVEALELLKRKDGSLNTLSDRSSLIQTMLQDMTENNDFADFFDTKLFGFAIMKDLVVPPWSVTHFRVNADSSEFFPYGTSPIFRNISSF